jgi:hypothetical protein
VIEYRGAAGNVAAPPAAVLDTNGRRFEILTVGSENPAVKGSREKAFESDYFGTWLFSAVPIRGKKRAGKSRTLSTGEQFIFSYNFEDPKSVNLKLVFADVPAIALPPAKDPAPSK